MLSWMKRAKTKLSSRGRTSMATSTERSDFRLQRNGIHHSSCFVAGRGLEILNSEVTFQTLMLFLNVRKMKIFLHQITFHAQLDDRLNPNKILHNSDFISKMKIYFRLIPSIAYWKLIVWVFSQFNESLQEKNNTHDDVSSNIFFFLLDMYLIVCRKHDRNIFLVLTAHGMLFLIH